MVALVAGILAVWLGAAVAHNLKGWRAALLPLTVIVVYALGAVLLYSLVTGAGGMLQTVLLAAGILPQ